MSAILNVNQTSFVFPCEKNWALYIYNVCKNCHLQSDFSSKIQSYMIISHHINVTSILNDSKFKKTMNDWHLNEQRVSWGENTCKLIHKMSH